MPKESYKNCDITVNGKALQDCECITNNRRYRVRLIECNGQILNDIETRFVGKILFPIDFSLTGIELYGTKGSAVTIELYANDIEIEEGEHNVDYKYTIKDYKLLVSFGTLLEVTNEKTIATSQYPSVTNPLRGYLKKGSYVNLSIETPDGKVIEQKIELSADASPVVSVPYEYGATNSDDAYAEIPFDFTHTYIYKS